MWRVGTHLGHVAKEVEVRVGEEREEISRLGSDGGQHREHGRDVRHGHATAGAYLRGGGGGGAGGASRSRLIDTSGSKYKRPFSMDYRERGSHAQGVHPTQISAGQIS